jgi:hypothetical protein
MPNDPRALEALKRWGISIAPQDDPFYASDPWLILGEPLDEATPTPPEQPSSEPKTPTT